VLNFSEIIVPNGRDEDFGDLRETPGRRASAIRETPGQREVEKVLDTLPCDRAPLSGLRGLQSLQALWSKKSSWSQRFSPAAEGG